MDNLLHVPVKPSAGTPKEPRATVRAIRRTEPIRLDGRLDEAVYQTVLPLTGFLQTLPDESEPATEETEAWITFDDENMGHRRIRSLLRAVQPGAHRQGQLPAPALTAATC